jgi:hypothetical protein
VTTAAFTFPRARSAAALRAPGLRFVGAQAARAGAPPTNGRALFVGFAARSAVVPRTTSPLIDLSGVEQFDAWIRPWVDGHLRAAVDGFFANGGSHCAVLALDAQPSVAAMTRPFMSGGALENMADIDVLCVPDAASAALGSGAALRDIQAAVLEHCEAMGERFAILDCAPVLPDADALADVAAQSRWTKSRFGALYFPWLHVDAPGRRHAVAHAAVPPCGHVAGLYARTDALAGAHRAPANDVLAGVVALDAALDDAQHGRLNDAGVNCIRSAPGRGIRVWGARTLSGHSPWRYVPVTRLFVGLTRWLKSHLDDIVFESHTPELWQRVQRRLTARCMELFESGALAGNDPASAFFVKCDAENNPPDSRDTGRLVADIGLAPSTPAEFIVVRISHDADRIAVTGP